MLDYFPAYFLRSWSMGLFLGGILCVPSAHSACDDRPSWIFLRSQYSHDPVTNTRVAQYSRIPPVEPLEDPRAVTSVYRRTRSVLRGADGASDTYYQVQSFGNGRGGLDAEWERFHDAWKESYTMGGYYNDRYPGYGYPMPRSMPPYGYSPNWQTPYYGHGHGMPPSNRPSDTE